MVQKSLLGHSKGGSATWQMMGLLQTIISGIIPGNHNSEYVQIPNLVGSHLIDVIVVI